MNVEKLAEALREIKALAETALAQGKSKKKLKVVAERRAAKSKQTAESLPDHILQLREEGFFGQAKVAGEVHEKLQATYQCDLDRVVTALLRLQKRKLLRRTSKLIDGSKQVAYVW